MVIAAICEWILGVKQNGSRSKISRRRRRPWAKRQVWSNRLLSMLDSVAGSDRLKSNAGAIVKWDHATMAWWNLGFKSPWLQ